jgi:hypothetical protein
VTTGTSGATGYTPVASGDQLAFAYYAGLDATSAYTFDVTGAAAGSGITLVTDSALRTIRVVPNPFVLYSQYQTSVLESRILFTNVPPTGTLRIYTVAGQFVQQITWTPTDLSGDGDLYYDLQTRGGRDLASGLYLWVVTAPRNPQDASGPTVQARGKFVVIRGGVQ